MNFPDKKTSIIHGCTVSSDGKKIAKTHSVPDFNTLNKLSDTIQLRRYNDYAEHSDLGDYWYSPDRYYQRDYAYDNRYPYSYWYKNENPLYDWTYPYTYQRFSNPYYGSYLRNYFLRPFTNYGLHRSSRYWYLY